MRYRKKPLEIEAVQYTGQKLDYLEINWDGNPITPDKVTMVTGRGRMAVKVGDYIITGLDGERYPMAGDVFKRTFERVKGKPEMVEQEEPEQEKQDE